MPATHVCELNHAEKSNGGVIAAAADPAGKVVGTPGPSSPGCGGVNGEPGVVASPGNAYTVPPGPVATGVGTGGTSVGG